VPTKQELTKQESLVSKARSLAARAGSKLRETTANMAADGKAKLKAVRAKANNDAKSQRIMAVVEAPVAAFAAGALDSMAPPIAGIVPWSAPVGIVTAGLGLYLDQPDLCNVGAGFICGAAYKVGNAAGTYVAPMVGLTPVS